MPELNDNVVIAEPIEDVSKLNKAELLGLYSQQSQAITHMQSHIEEMESKLQKSVEDNLASQRAQGEYSDRVIKVIGELERVNKAKVDAIFGIVSGMQTLLMQPNYDFDNKKESK